MTHLIASVTTRENKTMTFEIPEDERTYKFDKDGERVMIANFNAKITKETHYFDEAGGHTVLTIEGRNKERKFPPIEVNAEKFAGLQWVIPQWGVGAVVAPGHTTKEDLRAIIQLRSTPKRETVYTNTGWTEHNGETLFLHSTGAITKKGDNEKIRVLLPPELKHYEVSAAGSPKIPMAATLGMMNVAGPEIMWPLMATIIAPLHGPVDFALHITGRTGTFKSELAALAQSHYGEKMDARNLPGSWSSTANALEAQCHKAKNALFTIDDFIPAGTSWQVRAYQKTADQIIRGQGNQAGRARLTDVSSLQTTMYPRGVILSTGEDTPEGHSIRARMMIVELSPGDIEAINLTEAQKNRKFYKFTIGHYILSMLPEIRAIMRGVDKRAKEIRDQSVDIGHTRTPATIGRMIASIEHFITWMEKGGAMDFAKADKMREEAAESIRKVGEQQSRYLVEADPVEAFCEAIRHMIAAHLGHLRTRDGGIPAGPTELGWTQEETRGDLPTFKSHGKCIGWCDWERDELLIDTTAAYADIRKHSGGTITMTKITMFKRIKDAGLLLRVDETRQRNTVRVICENHPRQVLAMPLAQVLEVTERPNGDK